MLGVVMLIPLAAMLTAVVGWLAVGMTVGAAADAAGLDALERVTTATRYMWAACAPVVLLAMATMTLLRPPRPTVVLHVVLVLGLALVSRTADLTIPLWALAASAAIVLLGATRPILPAPPAR